eukprot:3479713-Pyramimonas_sp.AAC.1
MEVDGADHPPRGQATGPPLAATGASPRRPRGDDVEERAPSRQQCSSGRSFPPPPPSMHR